MKPHRLRVGPLGACICFAALSAAQNNTVSTLGQKHAGLGSCNFDSHGNSYCSDHLGHCIWKTNGTTGEEVEYAGTCGTAGNRNGPAPRALFTLPWGVCVTPAGDVVVADAGNACVRIIDRQGVVSTMAGVCGEAGNRDGDAGSALFNAGLKEVICLPNCSVVVDDGTSHALRLIDVAGGCDSSSPRRHASWMEGYYLEVLGACMVAVVCVILLVTRVSCLGIRNRLAAGIEEVNQRIPLMAEKRRRVMEQEGYVEEDSHPPTPPASPSHGSPRSPGSLVESPDPATLRAALLRHSYEDGLTDLATEPEAEGEWGSCHGPCASGEDLGSHSPPLISFSDHDVEAGRAPAPAVGQGNETNVAAALRGGIQPIRTSALPEIQPSPVRRPKGPFDSRGCLT